MCWSKVKTSRLNTKDTVLKMSSIFTYNSVFQVLICTCCETCIRPNQKGQTRHLHNHPHFIKGEELKKLLSQFETYVLKPVN